MKIANWGMNIKNFLKIGFASIICTTITLAQTSYATVSAEGNNTVLEEDAQRDTNTTTAIGTQSKTTMAPSREDHINMRFREEVLKPIEKTRRIESKTEPNGVEHNIIKHTLGFGNAQEEQQRKKTGQIKEASRQAEEDRLARIRAAKIGGSKDSPEALATQEEAKRAVDAAKRTEQIKETSRQAEEDRLARIRAAKIGGSKDSPEALAAQEEAKRAVDAAKRTEQIKETSRQAEEDRLARIRAAKIGGSKDSPEALAAQEEAKRAVDAKRAVEAAKKTEQIKEASRQAEEDRLARIRAAKIGGSKDSPEALAAQEEAKRAVDAEKLIKDVESKWNKKLGVGSSPEAETWGSWVKRGVGWFFSPAAPTAPPHTSTQAPAQETHRGASFSDIAPATTQEPASTASNKEARTSMNGRAKFSGDKTPSKQKIILTPPANMLTSTESTTLGGTKVIEPAPSPQPPPLPTSNAKETTLQQLENKDGNAAARARSAMGQILGGYSPNEVKIAYDEGSKLVYLLVPNRASDSRTQYIIGEKGEIAATVKIPNKKPENGKTKTKTIDTSASPFTEQPIQTPKPTPTFMPAQAIGQEGNSRAQHELEAKKLASKRVQPRQTPKSFMDRMREILGAKKLNESSKPKSDTKGTLSSKKRYKVTKKNTDTDE
jgi:hypothetical protein